MAQNVEKKGTITLGTRTIEYHEKTFRGTPVIPMWEAQMPIDDRANAAGLPLLAEARHYDVWQPFAVEDGAYNHYATLFFHDGRFHAMWANHWYGEDGPGQRILYSFSENAREWTKPMELFSPPDTIRPRGEEGLYLAPDRFVDIDGKLYAVVYNQRPDRFPIAREIAANGTLGEPFLVTYVPRRARLPKFMPRPRQHPEIARKINNWYTTHDRVSWWARSSSAVGTRVPSRSIDEAVMIESAAYRSPKGMVVLYRDWGPTNTDDTDYKRSNRVYVSFEDGKGGWSVPYPTNIPDANSRVCVMRIPDGRVLLVGNQIAPQFDSGLYMQRDPLTLAISPNGEVFTQVFALRSDDVPRRPRIAGITGRRIGGFGYPSMLLHEDMIYILYSIHKEDIAITIVPLSAIK